MPPSLQAILTHNSQAMPKLVHHFCALRHAPPPVDRGLFFKMNICAFCVRQVSRMLKTHRGLYPPC